MASYAMFRRSQPDTAALLLTWGKMRPAAPKSRASSLKKKVPRETMARQSEDDSGRPATQVGRLAGLTV